MASTMELLKVKTLNRKNSLAIATLGQQLNPHLSIDQIQQYLLTMFNMENYTCFGLFENNKLIGISSAWTTVRFYSGKQLEVDNVIISKEYQSKGYGQFFFNYIENWASKRAYKSVELNTYVQNTLSHKFYCKLGYQILGFHFVKKI